MNFIKFVVKKLIHAAVPCLLLFLFLHPAEALAASKEGLNLWLDTLLPTLLPFIILTGVLLHTQGTEVLLYPLRPLWAKLFGLSPWGAYAFLLGLLCGYPMGAKLTCDLYHAGKICKREAHYLLSFCNNPSPGFLIAYLYGTCLGKGTPLGKIFTILLLANGFCMVFFRFIVYKNNTISPIMQTKKETSTTPFGEIIDVSIMNGFETITRLGGYILLFSILSACISYYWPFSPMKKMILLGICEVTTGLCGLASSNLAYSVRLLISMTITAFGGLCILAQTKSVLKKDLSIFPYLMAKLLNAAVTAILTLVIAKVI
ncbi:MAG: hypothetical protein UFJ18_01155 [Blautia sp.]|nr:hypothetical protein [Blautia sp.]